MTALILTSLMFSALNLIVWTLYGWGALAGWQLSGRTGAFRALVVAVTMLVVVGSLGYAFVMELLEVVPHEPVLVALSAIRVVVLAVGIWLVYDEVRHPEL